MLPWLIAVAALAVACVAYGILVERRWYRLVRRRIPILPTAEAVELTVLHLSDIHLTRRSVRMRRFLTGLPACDICVVTGDIVGEPEAVEEAVEAAPVGELELKGFGRPIAAYEVRGLR